MVGMNLATALAFAVSGALAVSMIRRLVARGWQRPGTPPRSEDASRLGFAKLSR
jgi:hypothetical protein